MGWGPLLLLALLGACPRPSADLADADPVLGHVGPRLMRLHDLVAAARTRVEPGLLPRSGAGWEGLRARLIKEHLVDEVLLLDAEGRGLILDPATLAAEVDRSTADAGGAERLDELLAERHEDRASWLHDVERRMRLEQAEAAVRKELSQGVSVAPEQIDSAWARFAPELASPPRIRVRQMFFSDAESARGAQLKLHEGAVFAELVRSLTGEDGDSGYVDERSLPPLVLRATRELEPGGWTDVVPSPLGYHLFQLVGRQPGAPADEATARDEIRRRLMTEAVDSRLNAWIAAQADALGLFVDEDAVAGVRCCRQGLPFVGPPPEGSP